MSAEQLMETPADTGEACLFSTPVETRSRLWVTFPVAAVGHVLTIALIVSYGEFLASIPPVKMLPELVQARPYEVRFPQLRDPIRAPKLQKAAARPVAKDPAKRSSPSPTRTVLQLPVLPTMKTSDSVLLQPTLPPELAPKTPVRLPTLMFSAINRPRPEKPLVVPTQEFTPPEPPKLSTPPKLEVPNREVNLSDLRISATPPVPRPFLPTPPSNVAPVRNSASAAPPQPVILASAPPLPGDAVNVLSLPKDANTRFDRIEVPAGNQITAAATNPDVALRGTAPGIGPSGTAARGTEGNGATPNAENGPGGAAATGTGTQPGAADGVKSGVGTASTGNGADASTADGVNNGIPRPPTAPPLPAGTLHRVERPRTGDFEVVVVQSNVGEAYPETKGLLTGKPVYTAFVKVGGSKEWILQYCIPNSAEGPVRASSSVIQLGNPTPLRAPYPFVVVRPDMAWTADTKQVIIHGFVNQSGKFERLSVIGKLDFKDQDLLLGALSTWEFRPALRDGQAATVEILLLIPRETA